MEEINGIILQCRANEPLIKSGKLKKPRSKSPTRLWKP